MGEQLSRERIEEIKRTRLCDVGEINTICDMALSLATQAAEMVELRRELKAKDYLIGNKDRVIDRLYEDSKRLTEELIDLRQSTLTADELVDARNALQLVKNGHRCDYVWMSDLEHKKVCDSIARIDAVLSKLPPAPAAQKEEQP